MKKVTAGRDNLGEFAPQFAALNDDENSRCRILCDVESV